MCLQRTRCTYFRDVSYAACNKRNPGSGCAALDGFNRPHAVLGTSEQCIATYPGDFAQALIALDAAVEIAGAGATRTIPFATLHRKPGETPDQRNDAAAGRIDRVVPGSGGAVDAPVALSEGARSGILRIRAGLGGGGARSARRHGAQRAHRARRRRHRAVARARSGGAFCAASRSTNSTAQAAADAAFAGAKGHGHNDFKIELGKRTLSRALQQAAALEI